MVMDTSEQYIKMCDCPEIQGMRPKEKLHRSAIGDFCHSLQKTDNRVVHYEDVYYGKDTGDTLPDALWLPRQDQLQEMVDGWWKEKGNYGEPLIKGLYDFAMSFNPKPFRENELLIKSWEQLWLAFVMKEKYNKIWDGEKWSEV